MRFIVENFGAIERADIKLKKLNVFVGKNASGKSYLAYLIWSLLSVEPDWEILENLFSDYISNNSIKNLLESKERNDDRLVKELKKKFKELAIEIFKQFDKIWSRNLEEFLKNAFFVDDINELVRIGKDEAKIVICNDGGNKKIYFEINKGLKSWVNEEVLSSLSNNLYIDIIPGKPSLIFFYYSEIDDPPYIISATDYYQSFYQFLHFIPTCFAWLLDGYFPYATTFIAPDGRTGLIRSIEAYKYAIMSSKVFINEVDRKFMINFETLYPKIKNEEISKIADFIEEKLGVRYTLKREPPRYSVKIGNIENILQTAPSGYRELAPIVYAVRYALDKDNIVFIEEPEAHLHPDAQIIITRALAGLSNYCYIVTTTHSITVLDEISNLLKLKKLPDEVKKDLGYEEWEGLSPENVGIFLFSDGRVHELKVEEDGIEESCLDRVIIEIANRHVKVDESYEHFRKMQTQR